jgi:flagellar biosynthesis regulator FlaF
LAQGSPQQPDLLPNLQSIHQKVRRLVAIKQLEKVVEEVGAIDAIGFAKLLWIALLYDVLEAKPENQTICNQLCEILFYATREPC